MNDYKTGIFNWFGYILPLKERIRLIKQAGFDYVMLWWEDEEYPYMLKRMEFINILQYYDLKLDNVHLPYNNINNLWNENSTERKNHINIIKKWLNECKHSGADTVVMHVVHGSGNIFDYSFGYDSFRQIAAEAENINIKIAIENTRMFNYVDFILKEIESPNIGFCYDSSHDFIEGESSGEVLKKWKNKLIAVHLSDNDGLCDRHWVPGNGYIDWNKIINIIKQTNIKSYSMEVFPNEEEKKLKPSEFLMKAKRCMNEKL